MCSVIGQVIRSVAGDKKRARQKLRPFKGIITELFAKKAAATYFNLSADCQHQPTAGEKVRGGSGWPHSSLPFPTNPASLFCDFGHGVADG